MPITSTHSSKITIVKRRQEVHELLNCIKEDVPSVDLSGVAATFGVAASASLYSVSNKRHKSEKDKTYSSQDLNSCRDKIDQQSE